MTCDVENKKKKKRRKKRDPDPDPSSGPGPGPDPAFNWHPLSSNLLLRVFAKRRPDGGRRMADDKMRMTKCGWKNADDKKI